MNRQENILIGIAGPTCSGKTLLVNELSQKLAGQVSTLSFDEYDLWSLGDERLRNAAKNGDHVNWDSPEVFDYERYLNDLQKLRNGNEVSLPSGSRESQKAGIGLQTIKPARYTIVEGILIYCDERASVLFDRRFYIDVPQEEMLRRRIARIPEHCSAPANQLTYIYTTMLEGVEYYIKPQKERADVILDGTRPVKELALQVLSNL